MFRLLENLIFSEFEIISYLNFWSQDKQKNSNKFNTMFIFKNMYKRSFLIII